MQQRAILHSDMNSFYASVEMMLDPSLRGKAVAVCGSVEDRHGIVLAKSDLAKRAGVKTGMSMVDSTKQMIMSYWKWTLTEIVGCASAPHLLMRQQRPWSSWNLPIWTPVMTPISISFC